MVVKSSEQHTDFPYELIDAELPEIRASANDIYRACSRKILPFLYVALEWQPDSPQKWGIMFAIAHPLCLGKSMSEVAAKLGVSREMLSNVAHEYCDATGKEPSSYMRGEYASEVAKRIRLTNLEKQKQRK